MAITKILARKGRLDAGINYVLNGDKTQERVLTAHLNCDPGRECRQICSMNAPSFGRQCSIKCRKMQSEVIEYRKNQRKTHSKRQIERKS